MIASIKTSRQGIGGSAASRPPAGLARGFAALAILGLALTAQPATAGDKAEISDFVLSRNIVEREPVDVTDSFMPADQQAYAFARVRNHGAPTSVSFVWHRDNAHHATIHMNVGTSDAWRTWSSIKLQPGLWSVQLVSDDGRILGQKSFRIGAGTAITELPKQSKPSVNSSLGSQ